MFYVTLIAYWLAEINCPLDNYQQNFDFDYQQIARIQILDGREI